MDKKQVTREQILSSIASDYSDDIEFLVKINKITFGLISGKKSNPKYK